jgi:hypothetical protein
MVGTIREAGLILSAETPLERSEIWHIHVGLEIAVEDLLTRAERGDAGTELTDGQEFEVCEIHVSVAVGIPWDIRKHGSCKD